MKSISSILAALAVTTTLSLAEDKPAAAKPAEAATPAAPAAEGAKPKQDPEVVFKKFDTNGDGAISLEEFKASPRGKRDPAKAEEFFKKKDKDSDGKLTLEEFKATGGKKKDK